MTLDDARDTAGLIKEYDALTLLLTEAESRSDDAHTTISEALHSTVFGDYEAPLHESLIDAQDEVLAQLFTGTLFDAIRTRRDTLAALLIVRGVEMPAATDAPNENAHLAADGDAATSLAAE